LGTKDIVIRFVGGELESFDDEKRKLVMDFEEKAIKIQEYYISLGASSGLKDEVVRAKYDELGGMVGKMKEAAEVARWLVDFIDLAGSEGGSKAIEEMKGSVPNEYIEGMIADMEGYEASISEFGQKYAAGKADNYGVMTEEYGLLMIKNQELQEKYQTVEIKEIIGINLDEVEGWFERVAELRDYLEEKK
jgi:hypothetical protein